MRRSTTSVVTRPALGAVLGAELICAVLLTAGPLASSPGPAVAAPAPLTRAVAAAPMSHSVPLPDGRTAVLADLGARDGAALLDRIAEELPGAVAAVTGFWGDRWHREIPIVVAATAGQFATLAGGGADIAATTTAERITFSPAAAAMNDADLRTVLRHELFHFAARPDTAADAPVWLTEGVADYVGRRAAPVPPRAPGALPTDAELATPGPGRSAAYDRAWEFASYIAHTYGPDKLRALYVAACGPGHPDVATAVRTTLGVDPSTLTAAP